MSRGAVPARGQGQGDGGQPAEPAAPGPCRLQEGEDLAAERAPQSRQLDPREPEHAIQKAVTPGKQHCCQVCIPFPANMLRG